MALQRHACHVLLYHFLAMMEAHKCLTILVLALQAHPIHLWDACTGGLRCVYRAYDAADEITAAYSLAFNRQGSHIWAGYNKAIRIFDISRPGRDYQTITTFQKGHDGLPGESCVLTLYCMC